MSSLVSAPAAVKSGVNLKLVIAVVLCILVAVAGFAIYRKSMGSSAVSVPTVKVAQGDISLPIYARGQVRGGNSQTLTAPLTGGTELHILSLKTNGAAVKAGDVVVTFDPTDQEFALKEAESDMAEAEQHIQQATAQFQADAEEARYELDKAKSDLALAELEARKNPILSAIVAKQNDLAVAVAKDKLNQLEQDSANKKATGEAGIEIQQAARAKAESKMNTAKQNIQAMTLRAERDGYVAIKQTQPNFYFGGTLPDFQVGDTARPGVAVVEIPDLSHWEVGANIGELDQGHLKVGDKVSISVIALPGRTFRGHVADIGTSTGSVWNRHFECKVALDEQSPELRPGMSARVEITSETIQNALWIPAQALFESDGKKFVYLKTGSSFARKDVNLVRRNETRVILTGLQAGQEVALANPAEAAPKAAKAGGNPVQVLGK
jgi:RND family efflux transporter MFP subunit